MAKWGEFGVALFPSVLRRLWAAESLPTWLSEELGLGSLSSFDRLDATAWEGMSHISDRARGALAWYVGARRSAISELQVLEYPWPVGLALEDVPWGTRTRNAVRTAIFAGKLPRDLSSWHKLRFRDLFAVRSIGPMGILDLSCTLEAAIETHRSLAAVPVERESAEVPGSEPEIDRLALEVEVSTLLDSVGESWAEKVSDQDPRFRLLLPPGHGSVFERIDALTANAGVTDLPTARALLDAIPLLQARMRELDALPLDAALRDLVANMTNYSGARLDALIARLNWGGAAGGKTLEELSIGLGITRERMRQLQQKVKQQLPGHAVFMPALERALAYLEHSAPVDLQTAAASLHEEGITATRFHPLSVLAAARDLGHKHSLTVRTLAGRQILVSELDAATSVQLVRIANRLLSASGAVSVSGLLTEMAEEGSDVEVETARELLVKCGEYQFLDGEWFARRNGGSDFLQKNTRRMLAVVSEIEVRTLREGLGRAFRFRHLTRRQKRWPSVPPPRSVLMEYYRAHAEFVLSSDGTVRCVERLDLNQDLGPAERVIAEVLRAAPSGVMDRAELTQRCVQRGVSTSSIWLLSSYSPVVVRVDNGLWALRGVHVDPTAVESLRRARALRPREERISDHGWTPEGRLWFAYNLPQFPENAVIFVPAPIRRYLSGKMFSVVDANARLTIRDDGLVSGHKSLLRGSGADVGDVLVFSFELTSELATVRLDGNDYLDQEEQDFSD